MTILVTGGAGFVGSNFVLDWLADSSEPVVNLDLLSYAGTRANLLSVEGDERHRFVRGSIGDTELVLRLLREHDVRAVINFAAESHVDRSIEDPGAFYETNVMGTLGLIEAVRCHLAAGSRTGRESFRFLHVSTDEVYGSLEDGQPDSTEESAYRPSSPYAASKAASDHIVRAYGRTYGIPVLVTNCSNNYGPRQFPEKLIPLMVHRALSGAPLPVYGSGQQVRDWLYVGDHCAALRRVLAAGRPGATYNIGGNAPRANLEVVERICRLLDEKHPRAGGGSYTAQITHVRDRPGHDRRYGVDTTRIQTELGWSPAQNFETGLSHTVDWYLENTSWREQVTGPEFRKWIRKQYA
ncbi:MAG TPA: dTDP-glucose 4,6-dehydratase [Alphaproteobacteria bacterium]|nr:dTDP-glucose 4,6-dehydratase [Alphaproteobacteria bacterium]